MDKDPVRLTWGLTARGENQTATVYCPECRQVVARDVPVFGALEVAASSVHFCDSLETS